MIKMMNMRAICLLAFLATTPLALADQALDTLKAAHKGNVVAMRKIGYMKFFGKGTKLDRKNGLAWLKKAAEEGDTQAYYYLGIIYAEGTYVGKDMALAMQYLRQSAGKGYEKAKKKLTDLSGSAPAREMALMSERASMVDKRLPYGALAGDYLELAREDIARAKRNHCMPLDSQQRAPMGENTLKSAYIQEIEKSCPGLYVLYYLATKHEKNLDADNKGKIEAIYKAIREIGIADSTSVEEELICYEEEALKLCEKIFGYDVIQSEGVKSEALNHSWPLFAVTVLLYTRANCDILYNNGVGEMLEKLMNAKYEKKAVKWNFKWKICSLIDVFGGDIELLKRLQNASYSQFEHYRSKLLKALEDKYQSSNEFREHVSKTLDMLRAKEGEDQLIVDKYITDLKRNHFTYYIVPSLGQMCGVSL